MPNPSDRGASDESETNPEDVVVEAIERRDRIMVEDENGIALAFSRDGSRLDLAKVSALVTAVDALLGASLTEQARPLVRELRALVQAAEGPRAVVLDLRVERSKRES